uniref:Xylose isomerase-like TIM barrel domain-containing protein n=1 Tax=Chrysotila carterae TaxID=13221 RepID=A0A7S4B477_CHRCT
MRLRVLRSAWGFPHSLASPAASSAIRTAGFGGMEASLSDLGTNRQQRRDVIRMFANEGLSLILSAYSSWPNYEGAAEVAPQAEHLRRLTSDLDEIADLCTLAGPLSPVVLVNSHTGSDAWSESECESFLSSVLERTARYGSALPKVAHETHRGRILCCPFLTSRLLSRLPQLRITSDLSHWVIKTERMLDSVEEAAVLSRLAYAVDHVHARVGTPQAPQITYPDAPPLTSPHASSTYNSTHASAHTSTHPTTHFSETPSTSSYTSAPMPMHPHAYAIERFHSFWEEVWAAREASSVSGRDSIVTATVELGPPEYNRYTGDYAGYTPLAATVHGVPDAAGFATDVTEGAHDSALAAAAEMLRARFENWHAQGAMRRTGL